MSNDDRSRRVWRLLERGWTGARALKDAFDQVRVKVDEARVRLSDEVVSRLAGQPVRTQPDVDRADPGSPEFVETTAPAPKPTAEVEDEVSAAADAVTESAVVAEAKRTAEVKPSEPVIVPPEAPPAPAAEPAPEPAMITSPDLPGPSAAPSAAPLSAPDRPSGVPPMPTLPPAFQTPQLPPEPPVDRPPFQDGIRWADLLEPGAEGDTRDDFEPELVFPTPRTLSDEGDDGDRATMTESVETGELVVLARDAEWLFVYWDLDEQRLARTVRVDGDRQYLLKVFQPRESGMVHQSAAAVPSGRRYVRVPFADASYFAELWVRGNGEEALVARSQVAATPPSLPRPELSAAMVSSQRHREILGASWNLDEVPRLRPEQVATAPDVDSAVFGRPVSGVPTLTDASVGSEERLAGHASGALTAGVGLGHEWAEGSEARLSQGSEPRLGADTALEVDI